MLFLEFSSHGRFTVVCPKRHGQGSAPQEQSDWKKPSGRTKIRLFKTGHHVWNALFLLRSSTCLLADDPEASVALDTRLNIGLRKLAKRIQDFVKAVTSQSQQTNSAFHLNKETKSRQLWAAPVKSRSNDKAGDSLSTTWSSKLKHRRFP